MRIEIKTKERVKDPDIKAVYIINEAMKIATPRMRKANLEFVLGKYGLRVVHKNIK